MSQQVYDFRAMVIASVMWQIGSGYTKPPHTELTRPFVIGPTNSTALTPFVPVRSEMV